MAVALCDETVGLKLCGSLRHKCDLVMSLWVKVKSVSVPSFQGFNVDQGMNVIKDRLHGGGSLFRFSDTRIFFGLGLISSTSSGVRGYSLGPRHKQPKKGSVPKYKV